MKEYKAPDAQIVILEVSDVITASLGTETSIIEDPFGEWELCD